MAALMREFPQMKLTFNLVPSLLVQLEAFAEERARDWHLELGLKPARRADRSRARRSLAGILPRAARADDRSISALRRAAAEARRPAGDTRTRIFSTCRCGTSWRGSIRSTWTPTRACGGSCRSSAASAKPTKPSCARSSSRSFGGSFPEYRDAAERGQVELSTSPFYHPILPLLCDTDIYLKTHPTSAVPRPAFRHPDDAAEQLARARRQCHQRLFGREPDGLWPSEGSVSDEAADARGARPGFGGWRPTKRSSAAPSAASSAATRRGGSSNPEPLYRPYSAADRDRSQIACLFRDHSLSDLIGFVYAGWQAEAAAADFVNRLVDAGRRFSASTGGEEATISDHPRRRKRVGALRGGRPPVPARAVRHAVGASRASTGHDERGRRAPQRAR